MGKAMSRSIPWLRATGFGLAALASTACSPIDRFHGFAPTDAELSAVQVGQTTRDSIFADFGPPTSEGLLEDNAFYYVSSQFRHFGVLAPRELDRQVLAISFTPSGVVSNIERFTLEDSKIVTLDRRVTDDGIADVSVLSQLLGSFGRIDAGTLLNGP